MGTPFDPGLMRSIQTELYLYRNQTEDYGRFILRIYPPPFLKPALGKRFHGRTDRRRKKSPSRKQICSSSSRRSVPPSNHAAHPGGPLKTNKAAALAKFLERKLQDPNGLSSVDPRLVELAVKNAKETVQSSGTSSSGRVIRHVDSFGDYEDSSEGEDVKVCVSKKQKKKKMRKKMKKKEKESKKLKKLDRCDGESTKNPKKKQKL